MAEAEVPQDAVKKKKSKKPILIGLLLALIFGGGGFYAVYSGMILAPSVASGASTEAVAVASEGGAAHGGAPAVSGGGEAKGGGPMINPSPMPDIAFVPVEPLVISLGAASDSRHLLFTSQLEVNASHAEEVTLLLPRILDVLNGYLRAVAVSELEDPTALVRLRAQMLRRIQIVSGEGRVRDLLITEFVLN